MIKRTFIAIGETIESRHVPARLLEILARGESWLLDGKRAGYGLAVARILLGLMMLGMLVTNFTTRLYVFGAGAAWTGQLDYPTSDFSKLGGVADVANNDVALTAVYLLLAVCTVLFIIGYRTRLVMVPLFVMWVGLIEINTYVNDQSDNLSRIALILMFFAAPSEHLSMDALRRKRTQPSRNILVSWWRFQPVLPGWLTSVLNNLAVVAIATQLFFVYVSGAFYKAGGAPWSGGTAIYDPIHVKQFGPWPELSDLVTAWGPGVAFATYLTLLVQVSFPLLLLRRGTRIFGLVTILAFHIGIAVLMGLPWFSLSMIALDSIFIRDGTWRSLGRACRHIALAAMPLRWAGRLRPSGPGSVK